MAKRQRNDTAAEAERNSPDEIKPKKSKRSGNDPLKPEFEKETKEQRRERKRQKKLDKLAQNGEPLLSEQATGNNTADGFSKTASEHEARTNGQQKVDSNGSVAVQAKATKEAAKSTKKAEKAIPKSSMKTNHTGTKTELTATNEHAVPARDANTTLSHSSYTQHPLLSGAPQSEIDAFLSSNYITITDPTSIKPLRPIVSFSHLPSSALIEPSPFASFKTPTPIQAAAWPFLLAGRDVIGVAETGSGKTLAFGVPCIRYIKSLPKQKTKSHARAVMVSPTRELAVQIYDQLVKIATPAGLQAVCVYGGVPKDSQREALRTAHIVIATPGRLNDLINEGAADLSSVGYVVLDEADRMLDKGFEQEIRKIISTTQSPSSGNGRQTLMFTATWPPSIRELASTFMRSPVKIAIGDNPSGELRANARITQKVEVVDPHVKEMRLLQLIKQYQSGHNGTSNDRILVFCLYKKEATRVEGFLRSKGLRVAGIHGDLSQEKRTTSLEAFKRENGTPLLVATDVAARGLDIPNVKVVINVTFPLTVEDYVHRIGR